MPAKAHPGPGRERFGWWYHPEALVCGVRGHVAPALNGAPKHGDLVTTSTGGRRLARCLRCDAWIETPTVADDDPLAAPDTTPAAVAAPTPAPRRGQALREAIIVRLIAVDRAVHCVVFALVALGAWTLESDLPGLQHAARQLTKNSGVGLAGPGQTASRDIISRELTRLLDLHRHGLAILAVTATVYALVEGTEAVGLWLERRWAEYLTALATAGFLPFEVHELTKRVTALRIGALVVNIAVLAWLVWRKHLFGIGQPASRTAAEPSQRQA